MKVLKLLRLAERSVLVILFLAMVALFFTSVIAREIGGNVATSMAWVEEAVRLMNIFLVFLSLGLALERGKHVAITNLRDRLPELPRRILRAVIDLAGLGFSLYLAWLGTEMVRFVLKMGQTSPTLGIPMGWIYMAPVLGFGLLGLRYGLSLFGLYDRYTEDMPAEATP
ncbi:TRAP transporter small permease [Pseudooceanicola sp. CBS1P-1]|uniref:TRAP transporter small permease protein n=1 Tax=Pseudooceanicola albus TaxID=2692189 RepID=A0A6L7G428_9RHOB|nr:MULTISPECIES: TRAP transporter small permease [Pseudooceanicola]MBT9385276.1 TRAP transporter small permease [Pseudooceanicola endophyticus]MXN18865.1 TRAP transporter small permease subunit [Pseudooceanicola albus]